ncbi:MAG: hypothetical protein PHW31_03640 [Candidatus Pacebacteria bacterium]|nr:hypothetical protein [Candidatus Paceibacterota bacterium]
MKKIIGLLSVVIFCVLFSGLSFGVDENAVAVSAVDIWFPNTVAKWTYLQTDNLIPDEPEHEVNVWIEQEGKDCLAIKETREFLVTGSGLFGLFKIEKGNIFSINEEIVSAGENFNMKFSSQEWLLMPAQLKDGQEWTVVSYESQDIGKCEIKGVFKENILPSLNSETLLGRKDNFCRIDYNRIVYKDQSLNGSEGSFIFFPGVGIIEKRTTDGDGEISVQLTEFQVAKTVDSKSKMATTWGNIKTQ